MADPLRRALQHARRKVRYDSELWRRALRAGVQHGPHLWVRYSPHFFGLVFGGLLQDKRRAVEHNMEALLGPQSVAALTRRTADLFINYAYCLTESFLIGAGRGYSVTGTSDNDGCHFTASQQMNKGVIMATAHTAGWDIAGPLLSRIQPQEVLIVMEPERDFEAQQLHDRARHDAGVRIIYAGLDPLASLPLLHHLRRRQGIVAMKFDRSSPGLRCRKVTFLGKPWEIPEGIFTLAALSGAPILPVFTRRRGFLHYDIITAPPLVIPRRPAARELDEAAQKLSGLLEDFARANPEQWFRWSEL